MRSEDERIACTGCGRRIVPRLWHYGGGRLTHMRTQHMCPFCGAVLYETGGGLRRGCLVGLAVFALLFVILTIFIVSIQLAREFAR
jgi:ribosomal protein S27E